MKWFDAGKGFGFIAGEGARDVFVHQSAIAEPGYRTLTEGDDVEFDVIETPKGLQAERVNKVS